MKFLKKLCSFFSKKSKTLQQAEENRHVEVIGKLSSLITTPNELLSGLSCCIVFKTKEPLMISGRDIKLYEVYDKHDGTFVGSFYAFQVGNVYYGNMVGSRDIISCPFGVYKLKESTDVFIPLVTEKSLVYFLVCKYIRGTQAARFFVNHLLCRNPVTGEEKILEHFDKTTPFSEALTRSVALIEN